MRAIDFADKEQARVHKGREKRRVRDIHDNDKREAFQCNAPEITPLQTESATDAGFVVAPLAFTVHLCIPLSYVLNQIQSKH